MTPRSRQYNPPGSGSGNGGGLGAILAAMFGAPSLEGGEDITSTINPEVDLGTSGQPVRAPFKVAKPTLGQRIFNPSGSAASQQMGDMLKFEDFQNQLRSGLVGQHNQGQLELEKLRSAGDINEKQEGERIKKDEFARTLGLPSWEHAKAILSDPDVQTSVLKRIYADNEKQGAENDFTRAKTLTQKYVPVSKDQALFNPESGFTFQNQSPLFEEPIKGGEGGLRTTRLPVDRPSNGLNFVKRPGGVAAEVGSFSGDNTPDVSDIGNIFQPYVPQGSGTNPTVNGPAPAPRSSPLGSNISQVLGKFVNGFTQPLQQAGDFVRSGAAKVSNNFDTSGDFRRDFVDPTKALIQSIIGQSPMVPGNPNAYEEYLQQQNSSDTSITPSLRPVIQPPSILEEMRKRRQRTFPIPLQSYPFGR